MYKLPGLGGGPLYEFVSGEWPAHAAPGHQVLGSHVGSGEVGRQGLSHSPMTWRYQHGLAQATLHDMGSFLQGSQLCLEDLPKNLGGGELART